MPSANDLLKFEQLAKRLGVSVDTVQKWKRKGMPYIELGRFVFVSWNSFHRWARGLEKTRIRQDAPGRDFLTRPRHRHRP
jgi:hypothetical protein